MPWNASALYGGLGVKGGGLGTLGLGGPTVPPSQKYLDSVASDQPNSYFRLDDLNQALIADYMARTTTGTGSATGLTFRSGGPLAELGGAGNVFDGVAGNIDSGAQVVDTTSQKPFSYECWVKPTTVDATARRICGNEGAGGKGCGVGYSNAGFFVFRSDAAAVFDTLQAGTVTAGQWVHLVGTYDGATLRLYINGVLAGSLASSRASGAGATTLQIGGTASTPHHTIGSIAEVSIYGYALGQRQVARHFRLGQRQYPFSDLPDLPGPYVAHLYNNGLQFKRTLGSAGGLRSLVGSGTRPGLKMSINGGYHPIALDVAAGQPPSNLVADPGFEADSVFADSQANGWISTAPGECSILSTAADIRGGRRALTCIRTNLGPNNWNSLLSANFAVVPGQTYRVSGWRKQNAGTVNGGYVRINWLDASGSSISTADTPGSGVSGVLPWQFASVTAVAPANAVKGQFQFIAGWWDGVTGTNAQSWFDDARVVAGSSPDDPVENGDIIQLTEQGDPTSTVVYTGIVEEVDDDEQAAVHQLVLTPLVAELADTDFNLQYVTLVDVAQMVRDAVNKTSHLRVQPETCGDTGVKALYFFNNTHCLDVLNQAKIIAGPSFFWTVDASGLVWFQAAAPTNPAKQTYRKGSDYANYQRKRGISTLKNRVVALGGFPAGSALPITSTYSDAASILKYGRRNLDPPLVFPTVVAEATLDKIVSTYGVALNRETNTIILELPAAGSRLVLGTPGGLTVRLEDPNADPIPQPSSGSGAYLGPFVVQDIEVAGNVQRLTLSDVVIGSLKDLDYVINRIIQAVSAVPGGYS